MTEILARPLRAPSAWRGAELAGGDDWLYRLDAQRVDEIDAALRAVRGRGLAPLQVAARDFPLPACAGLVRRIQHDLEGGRGFAVLRGLPVARWSLPDAELAFWGLGTHFGVADPQDADGCRLHHVRDTGKRIRDGDSVRAYETNLGIPFHNDGSDFFMLLCVRSAPRGGRSRLISAVTCFNELVARRPDLAETLQRPFHFDARGQQLEGRPRAQVAPVYAYHAGRLNALHKRGYITLAQRFPEVPRLTPRQVEALDLLDEVCADPELALEFDLEPGDVLMANNYDVLHGRTRFDDGEAGAGRHMLRLWLTHPRGRPLPPEFAHTREFHWSYAAREAR